MAPAVTAQASKGLRAEQRQWRSKLLGAYEGARFACGICRSVHAQRKIQGVQNKQDPRSAEQAGSTECRTSKEKQQPLRGRNVKGFESLKKRLQEFEKTRRTGFGEIARVLGYLRRMPYSEPMIWDGPKSPTWRPRYAKPKRSYSPGPRYVGHRSMYPHIILGS